MSNTKGTSVISTPTGGGAQSGMGEKFSPDLFTGTGNFSVPIAVPPGRNGFQPELTLGYSTGNGNGVFGMGWALGIPGVMRKTSRGIPKYDDKTDIFVLSGAEDLVPIGVEQETVQINNQNVGWQRTTYRPRTEGLFARIVHHKKTNGEDYWEVRSKNGLISYYGTPDFPSTSSGQVTEDPSVIANPENRSSIFAWSLSKTVDPFGNVILYHYDRDLQENGPHHYDQLYLSSIEYAQYLDGATTKYLCEVQLEYEDRLDPFSTYKQGFEMRTTKRCRSIVSYTHAGTTQKTKTYHFNYLEDLPLNGASLLDHVSVEGHNDSESEFMPPLEFGYSTFQPSRRGLREIKGPIAALSLSNPGYELTDLNGNGLPDLLQLDGTARYWTNQGNGEFGPSKPLDMAPSVQLGQPGVRMIDANGNGRSDLMVNNELMTGYFPGQFQSVWSKKQFHPYKKAPSFSFADPEVQLIDLDGDGMTDVLRNGGKFECFYNDPQEGFNKVGVTTKTFADFSFADPRIRFADMTGDGLQDIVLISSGRVQYWPNLGYGRFGEKINMTDAPRFPEQYNPAQVLVGDLDGDGMADIAFVENNKVTLYVNQSANGFSEAVEIVGTPRVENPNDLRITDILGTGQPGILWSLAGTDGRSGKMYFLDFIEDNKPYILQEMNNNMGSITRVEYGSSIYHYLRDQKNPETRWKTELPFPVQVVNRVEVLDLLSHGKLATEYSYRHGYWDGAEREFRGFARVDARDTETFERFNTNTNPSTSSGQDINTLNGTPAFEVNAVNYTPPIETRNWFYPGPVGIDFTHWHEVDFTHEYWQGDDPVLERPNAMKELLKTLPRRAQRDALRTLRGTKLRSENYALDGSDLQDKPYTITENQMSVRLEFAPQDVINNNPTGSQAELVEAWLDAQGAYWTGFGYIFFPFSVGQRTSQYERGDDPMHSMSFTKEYDAYGQPSGQLSIGLPRGSTPQSGISGSYSANQSNPIDYLAAYGETEYIYKDIPGGQYMVDRVKRSISYDATRSAANLSVFTLKDDIFDSTSSLEVIGCSLNYYDGDAFVGEDYGIIGAYGALVRSETLIITDEIIGEAYNATPECFKTTPDWSTNYPAAFEGLLQNGDGHLGYKYHDEQTESQFVTGWYAESARTKYDFQDGGITDPVGLTLETKDVFDNRSTIEYDTYKMLPTTARQWIDGSDYLETTAAYDYRVMQAYKITDPNENITEFDFTPLGLLTATAVIGKGTQGDYKSSSGGFYDRFAPSVRMEYDFFAFKDYGDPVWVKTIQREEHYQQEAVSPTIEKVEYSDGFGRLLQTRAQAEDVIFGNPKFGSSGLSANQSDPNAPAVGIERDPSDPLNVVVSGWKIYNNKGKVVEQYEPFFDQGFDYLTPDNLGVKVRMYYDPLGRVVKTINPDNSEQRVIFGIPDALDTPDEFTPTPWENYAYDANDLAPLTNPTGSNVPSSHYYTPKSSLMDALGRTIETIEHQAQHVYGTSDYEDVKMKYQYDIRGNLLLVKDPYQRNVFEHKYDLRPPQKDENGEQQPLPPLWTKHIDQGETTVLFDNSGKIIETTDAKGAITLSAYDRLSRNTHVWAIDKTGDSFTLRQVIEYGDDAGLSNPENENLIGQTYKHYDEAGLVTFIEYDFKGNLLEKKREVISDSDILAVFNGPPTNWDVTPFIVDWDNAPTLEGNYLTTMTYDAMDRVTKMVYPEDVDSERKELIPSYSKSGALEKVELDGDNYVEHIAYNAQGQRLLVAYGNGVMSRYTYYNKRTWLIRMRSEAYSQSGWEFTGTGSAIQDNHHKFDLVGNIVEINEKTPSCGVGATNSLTREFKYDPLYRLIFGDGRENSPTITPIWDDRYRSTDNSTTTYYKQLYEYDKLGNILELQHIGNNNFTRNFSYNSDDNQLQSIDIGMNSYSFSYDACGNQTTQTTSRNLVWDFGNHLRAFFIQSGTSEPTQYAQYLYDAQGVRVKKVVRVQGGSYSSNTYIDEIFEYKTDGTEEQNTLHIMDDSKRIAMIRLGYAFGDTTPSIKYNLEDHILNSKVLLNTSGAQINKEEYYPFGETSFGSYAKKRYKFSGKECDEESGMYYFKFRYSAPWTCRFVSVDPLAAQYAYNSSYAFAENNVITSMELEGLEKIEMSSGRSIVTGPGNVQDQIDTLEQSGGQQNGEYSINKLADGSYLLPVSNHVFKESTSEADNIDETQPTCLAPENTVTNIVLDFESSFKPIYPGYDPSQSAPYVPHTDRLTSETQIHPGSRFLPYAQQASFNKTMEIAVPLLLPVPKFGRVGGRILKYLRLGSRTKSTTTGTTVYRAVSKAELDDIARFGGLRNKKGAYETGKLFAPTAKEAAEFGKINFKYDGLPNTLIKVRVPNNIMNNATKFGADGMNAISIPSNQLKFLNPKPMNFSPLSK